jgi:hypothetical protein
MEGGGADVHLYGWASLNKKWIRQKLWRPRSAFRSLFDRKMKQEKKRMASIGVCNSPVGSSYVST